MSNNYYKGTTERRLLFPCRWQDAAKFVTRWRDARIVFVKSNVTVKSVSEDSTSSSMGHCTSEKKNIFLSFDSSAG